MREPMYYARSAVLALDQRLIRSESSTPAATTYSVVLHALRRRDARDNHGVSPSMHADQSRWSHGCRAGSLPASRNTTRMFCGT